ncbi:MAG TPA: GFA family protein, partial [Steroidobacteraceae bacterium]|nr:GFA family protein [Steroidobacteraceae bacterium]
MKKTYFGSCHCGAVRFEADINLNEGTFKCNCSSCTKARSWLAVVKPDAFRLLAGESLLGDYQYGKKSSHHLFCKQCGISSFEWGVDKNLGGKFYAVNVACLDN